MNEGEALAWRKSTISQDDGCVVWAFDPDEQHVHVRDSKAPDGPSLRFTLREWQAFTAGVKLGQADY